MEVHGLLALLVLLLSALPTSKGALGTIIPLFTAPTDLSWTTVANGKGAHPSVTVVAVINPSNGPGSAKNLTYDTAITNLHNAGVQVLGYVSTSFGTRANTTVKTDIANYATWYTRLSGVFLAEMSNTTGKENYYSAITSYAKTKMGTSAMVVGDPRINTQPATYVGTVDIIVIKDSPGLPIFSNQDWHDQYPPKSRWASISYLVSSLNQTTVQQAAMHVGYFYATNSNLPVPQLPPYLNTLLTYLEQS